MNFSFDICDVDLAACLIALNSYFGVVEILCDGYLIFQGP